jgi:hypothetical protein
MARQQEFRRQPRVAVDDGVKSRGSLEADIIIKNARIQCSCLI